MLLQYYTYYYSVVKWYRKYLLLNQVAAHRLTIHACTYPVRPPPPLPPRHRLSHVGLLACSTVTVCVSDDHCQINAPRPAFLVDRLGVADCRTGSRDAVRSIYEEEQAAIAGTHTRGGRSTLDIFDERQAATCKMAREPGSGY